VEEAGFRPAIRALVALPLVEVCGRGTGRRARPSAREKGSDADAGAFELSSIGERSEDQAASMAVTMDW